MDDIGIHLQYRRAEGRGHCAEAMLLEWVEQAQKADQGRVDRNMLVATGSRWVEVQFVGR